VPISETVECKDIRPVDLYAKIRNSTSFLLESAIFGEQIARYSFIGHSPVKVIETNSIEQLRELLRFKVEHNRKLPPFFGGLVGYFPYEFVRNIEKIKGKKGNARMMLVKDLFVFDHFKDEIQLYSNAIGDEETIGDEIKRSEKKIEELQKLIPEKRCAKRKCEKRTIKISSNFTKKSFEKAVEKVKEYIYAGDIFQCVISQRFECNFDGDPFDVYLNLKMVNPSPYMYILEFKDKKIVGSSPEMLIKVQDKKVTVRPIAGTRRRGRDAIEDEELSREMLNDEKERAEHVMLVDLGRNDIGKVCRFGTVKVTEFMRVERYSHVQHIVSNIEGSLDNRYDAFDAFASAFPAGTVTGAPKIRAMEIIDEVEKVERDVYAGAIGYFSFNLNADFAIAIRTIVFEDNKAYIQAGAGIVADSKPEMEYYETINKGKAMIKAMVGEDEGPDNRQL